MGVVSYNMALVHSMKGLTEWVRAQENVVNRTLWPVQSADLDPVEYLHEILSSKLNVALEHHHQKHNLRENLVEESHASL